MPTNREAKISEILRKVINDPNAAVELLSIAADCLKDREPIPDALADYLSDAFKQAVRTKTPKNGRRIEDERINQLAHGLYMKHRPEGGAPRKDVPHGGILLAVAVYGDTEANEAETGLRSAIAEAGGVSKNTARTRIEETRDKLKKARRHVGNIRMRPREADSE